MNLNPGASLAGGFLSACRVIDLPCRPIFQPFPPAKDTIFQSRRSADMRETYPNHLSLSTFTVSLEDLILGPIALHLVSELLTQFSHHILSVIDNGVEPPEVFTDLLPKAMFRSHTITHLTAAVYTRLSNDNRMTRGRNLMNVNQPFCIREDTSSSIRPSTVLQLSK